MLEKINSSRTSNQKVMDSFQEKFMEKVHNFFYASARIFWIVDTGPLLFSVYHTFYSLGDRNMQADGVPHVHGVWGEQ